MTDATINAIVVSLPATIAAIGTLIVTVRTHVTMKHTEHLLNSNLEDWKLIAKKAYFAEGVKAEKEKSEAITAPNGPMKT